MTTKLSATALILALGSSLSLSALTTTAHAADDVKCYGIAEAGKNDCAAGPALPAPALRKPRIRQMPGNWYLPAPVPKPLAPPRRPVSARKPRSPPSPETRPRLSTDDDTYIRAHVLTGSGARPA